MPQLRLPKPRAIIFDITGTASNTTFVNRFLVHYLRISVKSFIGINWGHVQINRDINMLRKAAKSNPSWPQIPETDSLELIQQAVSDLINFLIDNNLDCLAFAQLRFHVWFDGYDKGLLKTPIYSDVAIQMKKWRCDYNIPLYVYSQGWAEANRVFMSRTNNGDMSLLIDDYFDTSIGMPTDPATFRKILEQIHQSPSDVVYLTKSSAAAKCAKNVGIFSVLVLTHKKMQDMISEDEKKELIIIRTMNEIEFESILQQQQKQ
ncbi:enolase-phosphatase E1 [Dermatophagoides farinae]|uniref:Enolase-phosphatase E1 n=1 Tax=Dermatophagoides farinae TaxID=6954 RepID=A0A922HK43_DERFA|nr:enolase-phosphatase E1-like [Dermatophagoides farinae]KAH7645625.1 hypothetical protein HUG17_1163 [Dermatophagoides farinae]KAH9490481.1 Enolase-phosphatase E1 [Dermatophagoides farinae]